MSWYNTGYDELEKDIERPGQSVGGIYEPRRLFVKSGEGVKGVLIDDDPMRLSEHQFRKEGRWSNFITCVKQIHPEDPACCTKLGDRDASFSAFYTYLDNTGWTTKKGEKVRNELLMWVLRKDPFMILRRKSQEKGGIAGHIVNIHRSGGDKSPNCGNDFEVDRKADLSKALQVARYSGKPILELFDKAEKDPAIMRRLKEIFSLRFTPEGTILREIPRFNYLAILAPLKPDEIRGRLQGAETRNRDGVPPETTEAGTGAHLAEEDVPF